MTQTRTELPAADYLPIAIRTYADHGKYKPPADVTYISSKYAVIFDCETTTGAAQALRFGTFQLRENGSLIRSGFFYDPQGVTDAELRLLTEFAAGRRLAVLPVNEFIEQYIYQFGYDLGAAIIGFNLPFDISRLAKGWGIARRFMKGGFTLRLSDDKRRPNIAIRHISSRMALIQFVGPFVQGTGRGMRNRGLRVPFERGTFIDVHTLAAALLAKSYALGKLAAHLRVQSQKLETDDHGGPVTEQYLDYALRDVQCTWECFDALKQKYEALQLSTPLHKIMSEASLGKAYLTEMAIKPWRQCQLDFPPELIGKIMSTYYGGRSEVHIRRQVTRVIYCDFLSMYPTVCTKMGLWKFVIADGMTWRDGTEEVRSFLQNASMEDFRNPETWKVLTAIVRAKPNGDLFPVRAEYSEGVGKSIGLNHLTYDQPLYHTLADCLVSKFLTGKVPLIEEAIVFEAGERQAGLKPVQVGGQADSVVDPYLDDFYKKMIELRQTVKSRLKTAPDHLKPELEATQLALKIAANATSYGIFVEVNVSDELKKRPVICYGPNGRFETLTKKTEQPGRYFHPLLATLITGAARLLLAMLEAKVKEAGLDWAFCDTDSMAIARPTGMTEQEFVRKVRAICRWFDALSPYNGGGSLLKIEEDNYALN